MHVCMLCSELRQILLGGVVIVFITAAPIEVGLFLPQDGALDIPQAGSDTQQLTAGR